MSIQIFNMNIYSVVFNFTGKFSKVISERITPRNGMFGLIAKAGSLHAVSTRHPIEIYLIKWFCLFVTKKKGGLRISIFKNLWRP